MPALAEKLYAPGFAACLYSAPVTTTPRTGGAERRRAPRAPADLAFHIATKGAPEPARLRDISTLGLSCETRSRIPEMTTLKVDLELPGGTGKKLPVAAEGVVVRCARLAAGKSDGYEVAIYFTRMEGQHRDAIGSYVTQKLAR